MIDSSSDLECLTLYILLNFHTLLSLKKITTFKSSTTTTTTAIKMKLLNCILTVLGIIALARASTIPPPDHKLTPSQQVGMSSSNGEVRRLAANDQGIEGGVFECVDGY